MIGAVDRPTSRQLILSDDPGRSCVPTAHRPDRDKRLILDLILSCGLNPRMHTLVRLIERDSPICRLHERR